MIKVICISDKESRLTFNKIYDAEVMNYEFYGEYYCLINDIGVKTHYYTNRFKLLSDWREQQIKSVIED